MEWLLLGDVLHVSLPSVHLKIPIAVFCCCFYSRSDVFKDSDPVVLWEGLPWGRKARSGRQ